MAIATRKQILMRARKARLNPESRKHYCAQCDDSMRKQYQETALVLPGVGSQGLLGALGPALVARLFLGCASEPSVQYQNNGLLSGGAVGSMPPLTPTAPTTPTIAYDQDTLGIGLNQEPEPLTARSQVNKAVLLKQPRKQRNFLRAGVGDKPPNSGDRTEYDKKGPAVNPWAICTSSVGRGDKSKYEECVLKVKSKNKIKKS